MKGEFVKLGLIGISLYLISTGLSFAFFSVFAQSQPPQLPKEAASSPSPKQKHFGVDPSIPRTEPCPLNGMLYTKQEKDIWSKRRPLAVTIENHEESRPQSGLYRADIVYEAVAEGGITRFLGIFYCGAAAENLILSPVRSARIYYLPWVLEYDALYNHVGGAGKCDDPTVDDRAKALCSIDKWKIKDMDQFGLPYKQQDTDGSKYSVCYRNTERLGRPVAWEHTMVCETEGLWKFAKQKRGWTNVDENNVAWDKNFSPWKFKDDAKETERGLDQTISYSAWDSMAAKYGVRWEYDRTINSYRRFTGGVAHKDLEIDEQLSPKVVILQFAKYTPSVDEHAHVLYENIGSGEAIIFQDGKAMKGKWSKPNRNARTTFTDERGKEIEFNKGQIWIDMLPNGTKVAY
jgi:hypothetical protein